MRSEPVTVGALAGVLGGSVVGDESVVLDDVVHDSREARPGSLFAAIPGFSADGHDYVPQAERAGASAALVERTVEAGLAQIRVADTRRSLAPAAAEVHMYSSN